MPNPTAQQAPSPAPSNPAETPKFDEAFATAVAILRKNMEDKGLLREPRKPSEFDRELAAAVEASRNMKSYGTIPRPGK